MATVKWHFSNNKSLEMLDFWQLLHRSIRSLHQAPGTKKPGGPFGVTGLLRRRKAYFFRLLTMASDFSTCSTGESLSWAEDMVASTLPSRPST
jgi:hypothetical protein